MQTKLIGGGTVVPGVEWGVDPTFQAGRVSIRPYDYALAGQILGHYRVSGTTAAILPSANAVLWSMRWSDAARYFVLMRVSVGISIVTAVTAQRIDPLLLNVQRAYTVSETTNATSILPTGSTGKARVNMGSSLVAQMAVASAASGISGGTRTADGQPCSSLALVLNPVAIGGGQLTDDLIRYDQLGAHPLVLSANEGLTIAWGATALATGTLEANVIATWAEVAAF